MQTINEQFKNVISNWWIILINGLVLLALGILVLVNPATSFLTFAAYFAISFIAIGSFEAVFALLNTKNISNWGWHLVFGLLNMFIGVLLLRHIELSILSLALYVAMLVVFRATSAIAFSFDLKDAGELNWGYLLLLGTLALFLGFILVWNPGLAAFWLVALIGSGLILVGLASLFIAIRLKRVKNNANLN